MTGAPGLDFQDPEPTHSTSNLHAGNYFFAPFATSIA